MDELEYQDQVSRMQNQLNENDKKLHELHQEEVKTQELETNVNRQMHEGQQDLSELNHYCHGELIDQVSSHLVKQYSEQRSEFNHTLQNTYAEINQKQQAIKQSNEELNDQIIKLRQDYQEGK